MSRLPAAEVQTPACGACGGETDCIEPGYVTCDDCRLNFVGDDLVAEFIDDEEAPCGIPCDNYWHGPELIKPRWGYDCHPCALPTGHTSMHWTGCENKKLEIPA